jgi:hypothetical protein
VSEKCNAPPSAGKTGDQLNAEVEEWIEAEMLKIDPSAYTK